MSRKTEIAPIAGGNREVVLHNTASYAQLPAAELHRWLDDLLASLAPQSDGLGVRFVSDRVMRQMNHRHRGKDATTDVLSFPGAQADRARGYIGDIAICVAQARRQAEVEGHDVVREIRLLLLHGVLHCLGWDHEQDDGEMAARERQLRREWIDR